MQRCNFARQAADRIDRSITCLSYCSPSQHQICSDLSATAKRCYIHIRETDAVRAVHLVYELCCMSANVLVLTYIISQL